MRVYLAAPLFSLAQRQFNHSLKTALEDIDPSLEIILPQNLLDSRDRQREDWPDRVYGWCIEELKKAGTVLAILDGSDADSGTCIEIGYGRALGKRIIGIRTDMRDSEDRGVNVMVSRCCDVYLWRPGCGDVGGLAEEIVGGIGLV